MIWRNRSLSARSASSIALSCSESSGRASVGLVTKRWNHNRLELATVLMRSHALLDRSARCRRQDRPLRLMDAPPIEAFEQGRELRRAQPHNPVMDLRPAELATLKSLRDQHHAGAVPEDQLDPVRPLRPKNIDYAAERIVVDHFPHQGRQTFGAFAEVYRLR